MRRNVFSKTLWEQRREVAIWSLGVAAVGVLYAAFYPTVGTPEMAAAMEAYPAGFLEALGMTDFTSPAGYLGSTTYGLLGPVLMIIFATVLGGRAIAGEEEGGRLELLLAHPVERWQVVVERAAAMVLALGLPGVVLLVAMAVAAGPAEYEEIGFANLAAASLQLVLLGTVFGSLALAIGAVTGRRAAASGAVAVIGIASYFANTLGPSVEAIAWTRDLSPFRYYSGGQPLVYGWQFGDALILLLIAAVLVAVGIVGFRRRDVGV